MPAPGLTHEDNSFFKGAAARLPSQTSPYPVQTPHLSSRISADTSQKMYRHEKSFFEITLKKPELYM